MTHTPTQILQLLDRHGLGASRALGQNFVADPNLVRRIARLADIGPGDHVLEIGPGLGSLTLALHETGASVTAIEVDKYLLPVLNDVLSETDVRVVHGDAMTVDYGELMGDVASWVLVANLPYNIATPLICDLLDMVSAMQRMVVMMQREPADRLVAGPGDRAYGIPSLKVAYWATARRVGVVPPDVFIPRPRVESALVSIERHDGGLPRVSAEPELLFRLIRTAFGQRRKMLRRSLAGLVPVTAYEQAQIAPTARPETLQLEQWAALVNAVV